MSLMCALGIATCISVNGQNFTKDSVDEILFQCGEAELNGYYSEFTYILVDGKYRLGQQAGYLALEILEDNDVDIRWRPKGPIPSQFQLAKYRKQQLVSACYPFLSKF